MNEGCRKIESCLQGVPRFDLSSDELKGVKSRLQVLYEGGPGTEIHIDQYDILQNRETKNGRRESDIEQGELLIPPETLLEELSQKLRIHPISVYWLVKEMREMQGLVCPSEQERHSENYASVMILRMLGYQWAKQIEAGEPLPE